jgi:hypothetical protein
MYALSYLDYKTLEVAGKNTQAKLRELKQQMQSMEETQRQTFQEFREEHRKEIAEAMAKYTATLSPKARTRFRKPIGKLLEEG